MATHRRYLTFSLRTLFLAMTALAVWLGIVVNRAREQREAVEAIEALGGLVIYDWQGFIPPKLGEKPRGPVWLRRIVGDDYFQKVTMVSIVTNPPPTNSNIVTLIPHLQRLQGLRQVDIFLPVQEETLRELKAALPSCEVSDWDLR